MRKDEPVSRRRFLSLIIAGVAGFVALVLAVPLVASLVSPVLVRRKIDSEWSEVGDVREFRPQACLLW